MTLKILLRREIQWCHNTFPLVRPAAKQVIEVLKRLVAKLEQDDEYKDLKISVWNTPWIPIDETEQSNRVQQLSFASIISQKAAREELNIQYTEDDLQIQKEQEDKIYRETYIKLKAEAQARKDFGTVDTATDVIVDEKIPTQKVDNNFPNKP